MGASPIIRPTYNIMYSFLNKEKISIFVSYYNKICILKFLALFYNVFIV